MSRGNSEEPDTRFSGYGDRVGSGVEFAQAKWKGGEIVTDPTFVAKALSNVKPRRFFYSPIGDGVVAADGVELKRGPKDLSPKVEVIHQRIVEKGDKGSAGRKVTEKTWSSGGGNEGLDLGRSDLLSGVPPASDLGANNAAPSASKAPINDSPFGGLSDPFGFGGLGSPAETKPAAASAIPTPAPNPFDTLGSRPTTDPYGTLNSIRSAPGYYDSLPKSEHDYPQSGRTSTTSALLSEPGYRYEINKKYKVTNPRELIHQFATTTPIQSIPGFESLPDGGTTTRMIKKSFSSTTEESYAPYPPYAAGANSVNPSRFVRQLRDENLTITQRQANQNMQPLNLKDTESDQRIQQIRRQTQLSPNSDVDSLTSQLVSGLRTRKY